VRTTKGDFACKSIKKAADLRPFSINDFSRAACSLEKFIFQCSRCTLQGGQMVKFIYKMPPPSKGSQINQLLPPSFNYRKIMCMAKLQAPQKALDTIVFNFLFTGKQVGLHQIWWMIFFKI